MIQKFLRAAGSFSTWAYCLANGLADRQTSSSQTIEDSRHQIVMDKQHRTGYNIGQYGRGTSHEDNKPHSERQRSHKEEDNKFIDDMRLKNKEASNNQMHVNECHMRLFEPVLF